MNTRTLAVLLAITSSAYEPTEMDSTARIALVKALDVKSLDVELGRQPLDDWFGAVAGRRATLEWSDIVCDLPINPGPGEGVCVRAHAQWREARATIVAIVDVRIGTVGAGVSGAPSIHEVGVRVVPEDYSSRAEHQAIYATKFGKRLSELPGLVDYATARARRPRPGL